MIGCTTLPAVSGILRTQAGRRGSGPGRWAGRDSALLAPPRRRAPTPPPPPPLAPRAAGAVPLATGRAGRVATSASSPGPLCGRGRCSLCSLSPFKGAAGPWSRAYHWHVCWAGVLRAPDRQQRAAASARASPGRAQSGYRPSESPWARGPFKLGGHQAGPCSVGPRARATGRARRACPSQPASGSSPRGRWGLNGRKPSSAGARLGRCGPRDRPAVDRRPGARLDRGLGVCSSTGSLQSR
jgi:hypothetical protein